MGGGLFYFNPIRAAGAAGDATCTRSEGPLTRSQAAPSGAVSATQSQVMPVTKENLPFLMGNIWTSVLFRNRFNESLILLETIFFSA